MTYHVCMKLISTRKKSLTSDSWSIFVTDMKRKLDVFLLADRITESEYEELINQLA